MPAKKIVIPGIFFLLLMTLLLTFGMSPSRSTAARPLSDDGNSPDRHNIRVKF
jgi:hypothetical protein